MTTPTPRDPRTEPKRGDIIFAPGLGQCEIIGTRGKDYLTLHNIVDALFGGGRRRIPRAYYLERMKHPEAEVRHVAGGGE